MPTRFTSTEKWGDPWFMELSCSAKLLFVFLCDKCDIAGFYERNDKATAFSTNIPIEQIPVVLKELEKSVVIRERWMFIKNFIRHQKNFPFNPLNKCHKSIIQRLELKSALFSDVFKELGLELRSPKRAPTKPLGRALGIGIGIGKGSSNSLTTLNEPAKPKELTEIQKVITVYKLSCGFEKEDKQWDKTFFGRYARAAKELIEFMGSWKNAADCVQDTVEKIRKWNPDATISIDTILTKHAAEWKKNLQEKEPEHGVLHR